MDKTILYYSKNAHALVEQYHRIQPEVIHKDWLNVIPKEGMALDVGAGSGRDARFLAAKGLNVIAVEPAQGIRDIAQRYQVKGHIHWLSDSLPELREVFALQVKFDLILLSAVWMHIAPSQRSRCIRKLSTLLKPNGKLIISLRHGHCHDERIMHPVSASELAEFAKQFGLMYTLLTHQTQTDHLGREDVRWQTVLLQLPDDGTGALPLIRNIVVNDSKSSTYKVALLRSLLRIAEGHPGAIIEQNDDHIVLPIGLIALYWLKLYKPLIDQYGMQQNSSNTKGLGFIKNTGWEQLKPYTSHDFYLGASYTEIAPNLYQTLKDISSTIKNMPAKYIKLPHSQEAVFHVELTRTTKPKEAMTLNFELLASMGKFYVPLHLWDALTRFSVWIEPTLINEWATLMAGFGLNKENAFSKLDYLHALHWEDSKRTTSRIRKRVDHLLNHANVICCWSGAPIKANGYAVDHAFPFARWPNNDLWNLLPTKEAINLNKSDKLPTNQKMIQSRDYITAWWQQGWGQHPDEFFTQANFALPSLAPTNRSFDDVFEAFVLQRDRIKDFQQLRDW